MVRKARINPGSATLHLIIALGLAVLPVIMPVAKAETVLKGNYISGRFVTAGGFPIVNGTVKLVDVDDVMLSVTTTVSGGHFKLPLDTLEGEDRDSLNQAYLHLSDNKGNSIKIRIGGWAAQERGYIKVPTISLQNKKSGSTAKQQNSPKSESKFPYIQGK